MKIVTVIGARPQFIKAAAISRAVARHAGAGADLREVIVHTGQHYDRAMSDVFFEEMAIPRPDYRFDAGGGGHGAMTGRMLEKVEEVLLAETPDAVLVYGDTNTTLAGALAASKLHIPVAHVEAGLRSFNMRMPEEVNRVLTDRVSTWLFCPTHSAVDNLREEGVGDARRPATISLVGDVMYDTALYYAALSGERAGVTRDSGPLRAVLDRADGFALCTVHRAENTDDPARLAAIFLGIALVARDLPVVLPLHPRTRKRLAEHGIAPDAPGLHCIDPVGYFDMIELLKRSRLVLTDSGGLQKEACFFGSPCVTLRDETEWVELVQSGVNVLVGADADAIAAGAWRMLAVRPDVAGQLYGDGDAAGRIVAALAEEDV
ncbi:MAG: non-hydrolyzing UDP-N-acetylglucosamine 2-epimerase [Desulfovibrionaceae bacterium]